MLAIGTWPLTTAWVAAAGWNGTWVMSTLASALNSHSAPRCVVVPLPDEAYDSLPTRASASSSGSVVAFTSGCTYSRLGVTAAIATGARSASAS